MRRLLAAVSLLAALTATAAQAEVSHSVSGRFGVAFVSDPAQPQGQARPLYEGRYTTVFTERSDRGLTFRFEMDVIVGNIPEHSDRVRPVTGRFSVGTGTD